MDAPNTIHLVISTQDGMAVSQPRIPIVAREPGEKPVKLLTIPQIAKTGILNESTLRKMDHCHLLPSIKVNHRTYVNYWRLVEMLDTLHYNVDSAKMAEMLETIQHEERERGG